MEKIKNMIISKKKSIVVLGIVLVVFVVGAFGAIKFLKHSEFSELGVSENQWSVVYLTTGEVYIGKISPVHSAWGIGREIQVSDSYLLQVVKNTVEPEGGGEPQVETNFQLTPINEALWAPEKLYVNKKQVVFYGPVLETSKVGEAIKEAGKW